LRAALVPRRLDDLPGGMGRPLGPRLVRPAEETGPARAALALRIASEWPKAALGGGRWVRPRPRQGSEPADQLLAVGGIALQEDLELGARGLEVPQVELAPDEQPAGLEIGGVEPEGLPAGRRRGRPIAVVEAAD